MEREIITAYTDGSCYWKLKKGGCGIYIIWNDKEFFIQKGYKKTTIGRCELRAFLLLLKFLQKDIPITATVYSDSQYVVNGLNNNLREWIDHNWADVANEDLWKEVVKELDDHPKLRIRVRWIPGHRDNIEDPNVFGNNVADILADYKQFEYYELDKKE
mgnify:CR=1 FL=1